MKKLNLIFLGIAVIALGCTSDTPVDPDPGESTSELLVAKFDAAPTMDGVVDDMWSKAQRLVSTVEVPNLGERKTYLNSDGENVEETLGLFEPYSGEQYDFKMRSGFFGDKIYFLIEWQDADDSKDRQSWYFDATDKLWKNEHKYANTVDDKFYEDKFAFLFPIGEVAGFSSSTCYATCHTVSDIAKPKDKHTRHYLKGVGEKVDMWHWKRVRGTYADQVDDQRMLYVAGPYTSGSNGRKGDANGEAGYAGNSQKFDLNGVEVSIPKYIIPDASNYYWIDADQIANNTAKLVTGVDVDGVLAYNGGFLDPNADLSSYAQKVGTKRFPSVLTKAFTGARADIDIKAVYTGTGWICEVSRKLNTGDEDDVVFKAGEELPFGFAIFNNAAIAHAIKPGLLLKFDE